MTNPTIEQIEAALIRHAELQARVGELEAALAGVYHLYGHVWDRVDGDLVIFRDNVPKFDAAFCKAGVTLGLMVEDEPDGTAIAQSGEKGT